MLTQEVCTREPVVAIREIQPVYFDDILTQNEVMDGIDFLSSVAGLACGEFEDRCLGPGDERVIASTAVQNVAPPSGDKTVVTCTTKQDIVACAAENDVIAIPAEQLVIAPVPGDLVVASATIDNVVAPATFHRVVSGDAPDRVIAELAIDPVGRIGPEQ